MNELKQIIESRIISMQGLKAMEEDKEEGDEELSKKYEIILDQKKK